MGPLIELWETAALTEALGEGGVHVWRVVLDHMDPGELVPRLPDNEQVRASSIPHAETRHTFVVARWALRTILSRYADKEPGAFQFERGKEGKPHLPVGSGLEWLRFNVTHSGRIALVAVARAQDVGIDIERVRPRPAWRQLAERFFTEEEQTALHECREGEATRMFLSIWCRREACVKSVGRGITLLRHRFVLPEACQEPARTTLPGRAGEEPAGIWLKDLSPGDEYVGAVACVGTLGSVRCFSFGV